MVRRVNVDIGNESMEKRVALIPGKEIEWEWILSLDITSAEERDGWQ